MGKREIRYKRKAPLTKATKLSPESIQYPVGYIDKQGISAKTKMWVEVEIPGGTLVASMGDWVINEDNNIRVLSDKEFHEQYEVSNS